MKVTLLDTQTGITAESSGVSTHEWEEGDYFCDCNRQSFFDEDDQGGDRCTCLGCHRYIIIAAECEDDDDRSSTIEDLNANYPLGLLRKHGAQVQIECCKICGSTQATYRENEYNREMGGLHEMHWICDSCERQERREI